MRAQYYILFNYNDYHLPSKDELNAMHTELHLYGLGGFNENPSVRYWTSSEINNITAWGLPFETGVWIDLAKNYTGFVRACRAFTSNYNYNLRDLGPGGGYIFWKSGNSYIEAAPTDQSISKEWSNIYNGVSGASGTAIGTGQANTAAIIAQVGHTDSAAKLCDDLIQASWLEFWPSNTPVIKLVKETNEIFKRWTIDKFRIARSKNATIYDTIAGMFFDKTYFGTDIKYKIKDLGTDKFYFICPVTSGNLDSQNSVYEVNPDPDDLYRPILQQYEKKWSNKTANTLFSNYATIYYPYLNTSVFVNVDFTTFTDTAHSVSWSNTSGSNQYARNLLDVVTNDDDIITVIISSFTGLDFDLQLVDESFNPISVPVIINANGKYEIQQTSAAVLVYLEMYSSSSSGTFDYKIYYPLSKSSGGLIHDVIDDIINNAFFMNLSYSIVSTILWNDALGSDPPTTIDTYITANPTKDYVIEDDANWNYLWLARTDSFTTDKEDNIEMSLKDLMDILKLKMRLWWFIDEDGYFRIEHERYFREYTPQADLTSVTYAGDKPEVDHKVYNYTLNESVFQITFSENNKSNPDWIASDILFPVLNTSKDTRDINISSLTTDIEYVIDNPSDASSSGVMLLKCKLMGTKHLVEIDQSTEDTANYFLNARLGWYYLHANYFDYFAEAESGTVNGGAFTFTHVKEFLKQNKVKFRIAAAMLWYKPFTLSKGTGWIEDAEYDPETGMYSVNFGFDPY